ncbi:hypothetical protein F5148DRAFT_1353251 [Russula earlei]|uniref:Uncharacterized protein n=2 Tax=Russula earlei TaxID=71964 RepID=A0ACC0TUM0_9AGAM|nr:hypothetical protein F5148DRAFT_628693 [Russula earlei]KAI9508568.1 hypothetical protein F5148DRAFT_1353251 [Russula earlei]
MAVSTMSSDIPPYQVQPLISTILDIHENSDDPFSVEVKCVQALGSEIYVGCSNGDILLFALQTNGPHQPESYTLVSRQVLPTGKAVEEIVLTPCISKALILSDRQIFFFVIPSLELVSSIKPIRNVMAFAVDHQHIARPMPSVDSPMPILPVDFCVVKRTGIVLYSLRESLSWIKDIPLQGGAFLARRTGLCLCIADREQYTLINLDAVTATPILPISQVPPEPGMRPHRPMSLVVAEEEFLILSWTGTGTMGVFINLNGDPVRGTLQWPSHPLSICLEYPYVTALLSDQTIQVHNVESQEIVQEVPAPPLPSANEASLKVLLAAERRALTMSPSGFLVPWQQQPDKQRLVKVNLLGRCAEPGGREVIPNVAGKT